MNPASPHPVSEAPAASWPPGGGAMGQEIRAHDWAAHPLGTPDRWPQSLRTTISLMLNSRFAMWMGWSRDYWFFCNDAYLPTLGIKKAFIGAPAREVWQEVWDAASVRADSVLESGQATWDEGLLLFLERNGYPEETYHTFSYSPIPDDDGQVGGMLCVVTEETERIISERRLAFLRDLAARLTGVTAEADLCLAFQQVAAGSPKDLPFALLYLTRPDATGSRLACQYGLEPGHAACTTEVEFHAADQTWPLTAEGARPAWHICRDLKVLGPLPQGPWDQPPKEAAVVPIADPVSGVAAGHLIVGLNPYRPLDEEYQGFLGLLAGQLSAALANVRTYEQERRRAEELAALDRAKTVFFSNVSHELRTPLTLMLAPLEEVLSGPAGGETGTSREMVSVAHRNGLRLLKLVNTLLDFSKLEAGHFRAVFAPEDLAALTEELAESFRPAVEKAGLTLQVDCPPLPEPVYLDREMWEKIVLNLLSNAFKFTLTGGITLSLRAAGGGAELTVGDTGTGIPQAAQERLFERFYRVPGSTGRSHEGTGIGLALVSELAQLHGGTVAVASEPGKGSTFTVRLPLGSAHLPAAQIRQHAPETASRPSGSGYITEASCWLPEADLPRPLADTSTAATQRPQVLVVDDNADMRGLLAALLSKRFDVRTATDGAAALAAVADQRPDLVLSDVMMPGLDGFGLLSALRRQPETADLPVILLSARAGDEARVDGLEAGADDYLIKPFDARELMARVTTQLALARLKTETAHKLAQAEGRLQHMLTLLPMGVYACDLEGRITFYNRKAVEMWGITPEPECTDTRFCVFPKAWLADGTPVSVDETPMAQAVRHGSICRNAEVEVERQDGKRFFASVNVEPLRDDNGAVVGAINVFHDVTESRSTALALTQELQEKNAAVHHADFLTHLSQKLDALSDPAGILQTAVAETGRHLHCSQCLFIEPAGSGHRATVAAGWSDGSRPVLTSSELESLAPAPLRHALRSHGVTIHNTATDPLTGEAAASFQASGIGAMLATIFTHGGRVRAMLVAISPEPRTWHAQEVHLLEHVANRVQPLAEQSRANHDLQTRGERMQLLSETLSQLLSARNPDTVVKDLFARVSMHLQADIFFNFMVNQTGDALDLHSYGGVPDQEAAALSRLKFGELVCGKVAESGHGRICTDLLASDEPDCDHLRKLGVQCYVCNPLMAGGRLLGTLSFASRMRPSFDEDELEFIRIATQSAALVLEQLRTGEIRQRLAAIVTSSEDAIVSKNLKGEIMTWNNGAQRMFGYEASEVIGRPITLLIPEDRYHEEPVILAKIGRGEVIDHFETIRRRKDGSLFDIALTISPIRDSEGTIIGVSKIGRDITERKKNEQELAHREQLYRSIGESINYGIWVCDPDGRLSYVSESMLALLGITLDECRQHGITDYVHPEDRGHTVSTWEALASKGGLLEVEHRLKGADGTWHPVLVRGIPIRDRAGEIVRWAGINLDISSFKKTEEALRQQSRILALLNSVSNELVAERDLDKIVQTVIDACREISGAEFGAFFYNVVNGAGESYTLYSLSGAPKEAFAGFPMPRNTALFGPTFTGQGVVRLDDVQTDPRYGQNAPFHGMPPGHLPVRSYLAIPVVSKSGNVIGGMFFGHGQTGVFTEASESILLGIAAQAAIAIDNAQLYSSLQRELEQVKRVETALRSSEQRWRDMAVAMPHLVWTSTPDGGWDYVSPQWCTYTGHQEEEQREFGWTGAIHPDDRPALEQAWNQAAHNRSIVDVEVRIRRADSHYRWFKTRAMPVMDEAGNIVKWYGSNTDIEDIKQTDIILGEREARLSAIFAQAGAGIVQTDLDGTITMVNDAYCEIVERSRDELLGVNIHALTHPDDRTQNRSVFEAMIRGESSYLIEKRDVLPGGQPVWVRSSLVGIRDEGGKVVAGLIITQDITDSREAEDALRASEEQLRLVTDHAPVLLAQIDRDYRYKFANKPYAERYGYEPQEIIGKHVKEVASESAFLSAVDFIDRTLNGERIEYEMAIPYEGLGTRWGHVIFVPERNAAGEVVGVVTVLTDITIRKQAEQELEQARDRALEAVRAKDDFLARLSHELRTPLSPVLLLASEGCKNTELPPPVRADFETIRKNVDLEARLIDDLLDLTRITRGKLKLDLQPLDLNSVIADALATLQAEALTKGVTMKHQLHNGQIPVLADAVRLQQVLWNLLNNALKFTPAHGDICIRTVLDESTHAARVEVSDSGIGMTAQEIEQIFEAFSQGEHAQKGSPRHFGGLGLGLAISRMLVELHQGRIEAASPGRNLGATFTVTLPLADKEQTHAAPATPDPLLSAPAPTTATRPAPARLRILLVEDHAPTREALSALLRRRKHLVSTAGSLEEARKLVIQQSFDLLISDLGLPDGTGYELMAELAPKLPLKGIAVSGFGMEHDIAHSQEAGFVNHLIKPVRIEALEAALAALAYGEDQPE